MDPRDFERDVTSHVTMEPADPEPELPSRSTQRRRVVIGALAVAAIAIPSVAIASGGGGSSGSSAAPGASDGPPTQILQDEGGKRGHDGRLCPKKNRNRGTGAEERDL